MPFRDAVELFEYWGEYPPVHMLVRRQVGYEGSGEPSGKIIQNPVEIAAAMQALGWKGKAPKLSTAPEIDRARFESLKQQLREKHG